MVDLEAVVQRLDVIEHLLRVIVKALMDEDEQEQSVTSLDGTVTSKARDQGQSL